MKLLEESAPAVKAEAPEQLQLVDNVAVALDVHGQSNCNEHSTCHDHWSPSNAEIVLSQQPTTRIYRNARNEVVIRQEDDIGNCENYLVFTPAELPALIERLQEYCFGGRTMKPFSDTCTMGPSCDAQSGGLDREDRRAPMQSNQRPHRGNVGRIRDIARRQTGGDGR